MKLSEDFKTVLYGYDLFEDFCVNMIFVILQAICLNHFANIRLA